MTDEEIIKDEASQKVEEAAETPVKTSTQDAPPPTFQSSFVPETPQQTIRNSGLAYSAALVLAGSIIFLLFIGWILDSFLGTSPWCLVGGIALGSIIGFYQFFTLTSKILKP